MKIKSSNLPAYKVSNFNGLQKQEINNEKTFKTGSEFLNRINFNASNNNNKSISILPLNNFNENNLRSNSQKLNKYDDKNKLTNLILENITINRHSNNNLQYNENFIGLKNGEMKKLGMRRDQNIKKNFTFNDFYNSNNEDSNTRSILEIKTANKVKNKDKNLQESSEKKNSQRSNEQENNDGFLTNRTARFNQNSKILDLDSNNYKLDEITSSSNSKLKLPKNFLIFNSDLFKDGNNQNVNNKSSNDSLKNKISNIFSF